MIIDTSSVYTQGYGITADTHHWLASVRIPSGAGEHTPLFTLEHVRSVHVDKWSKRMK